MSDQPQEMKVIPIQTMLDCFQKGTDVSAVEGKVIFVGKLENKKWTTGQAAGQDYTEQYIMIAGPEITPGQNDGPVIGVKFRDRNEIPESFKFREIRISSVQGKNKIVGVRYNEWWNSNKGETVKELQVSNRADCKLLGGNQPQQNQGQPQAQNQQQPPPQNQAQPQQSQRPAHNTQRAPQNQPQQTTVTYDTVKHTKRALGQICNLYQLCMDAAVAQWKKIHERHGIVPTSGSVSGLAMSLFIEGNKKGIYNLKDFPYQDLYEQGFQGVSFREMEPMIKAYFDDLKLHEKALLEGGLPAVQAENQTTINPPSNSSQPQQQQEPQQSFDTDPNTGEPNEYSEEPPEPEEGDWQEPPEEEDVPF